MVFKYGAATVSTIARYKEQLDSDWIGSVSKVAGVENEHVLGGACTSPFPNNVKLSPNLHKIKMEKSILNCINFAKQNNHKKSRVLKFEK